VCVGRMRRGGDKLREIRKLNEGGECEGIVKNDI
jgi:hypothetical protein